MGSLTESGAQQADGAPDFEQWGWNSEEGFVPASWEGADEGVCDGVEPTFLLSDRGDGQHGEGDSGPWAAVADLEVELHFLPGQDHLFPGEHHGDFHCHGEGEQAFPWQSPSAPDPWQAYESEPSSGLPSHPHAALGSGGDEALGTPGATPRWWSGVFPAAQEAAPQTDYTEFDTYFFVPTAPEGDPPDFATLDTHSTAAVDFDRQSVQFSDDDREPANAEAPASGEHAQPGPTPDGDAVPVGHLPRGGGDRAGHTLSALDDQPQASNAQDEEQIEEEDEDPPAPQIARRLSASLTERQTLPPGQQPTNAPPKPVAQMNGAEKLAEAFAMALEKLDADVREVLAGLISPEALAQEGGMAAALGVSHLVGVGEIAEAMALLLGAAQSAEQIMAAAEELEQFLQLLAAASTEEQLLEAAEHLRAVINLVGPDLVQAVLTKLRGGGGEAGGHARPAGEGKAPPAEGQPGESPAPALESKPLPEPSAEPLQTPESPPRREVMAERESASAPVQPEANRREGQPTVQADAKSPPSEAAATAPPPIARQLTPEEREAHPEWHGNEAARHLGLPEAEPGYEWYFDPTDSLTVRYRRSQGGAEKLPKKKWNSETNAFEVDAGEIDFPARYKGETRVYENIDRAAYEEALDERDRLIAERDLHRAETEEWRKKNAEVAEKSRQIGAAVAEEYIRKEYPEAKKLYGGSQADSNSGDFDDVYIIQEPGGGEKFIILETKGGSDSSSTRMVGANKENVAEQGSPEYFDAIVGNMKKQALREENSEMVIWLDKLEKAKRSVQKNGEESVVYRKVIVPIKTIQDGNGRKKSELSNPKIKDYDLSEQES